MRITQAHLRLFPARLLASLVVVLTAAALPGCGPGNPLGREAVSGRVSFDGQPLANGNIEFVPAAPQGVSSGTVIVDGKYRLPEAKGLPPGSYRVRIFASRPNPAPPTPEEAALPAVHRPGMERVAARFNTATELTANVTVDGPNCFDYAVSSK